MRQTVITEVGWEVYGDMEKQVLTFREQHKDCPKDLACQICICEKAKGKSIMWICPVHDLAETTYATNYP